MTTNEEAEDNIPIQELQRRVREAAAAKEDARLEADKALTDERAVVEKCKLERARAYDKWNDATSYYDTRHREWYAAIDRLRKAKEALEKAKA